MAGSVRRAYFIALVAVIAVILVAGADAAPQSLAKRGLNDPNNSGSATWYNPGLGACEWTNGDGDMIVALSAPDFGPAWPPRDSPACGACISVTAPDAPGKPPLVVKIVDKCPGCTAGDLNLSPAAFQHFYPLDKGRFRVQWSKVDC